MNEFEVSEIIAKELNGQNDWNQISRRKDMTPEQLRLFKDHLVWWMVVIYHKNIPNDLLDEMITTGKYDQINWSTVAKHANELWFVKKYKDNFKMHEVAENKNFKPSELIEVFGAPKVGDGATISYGSDCEPYTIIEVSKSGLKIKIQADKAIQCMNYDYYSNQNYTYRPDPNGVTMEVKLGKDGRWKSNGSPVAVGFRRKYQDPHR